MTWFFEDSELQIQVSLMLYVSTIYEIKLSRTLTISCSWFIAMKSRKHGPKIEKLYGMDNNLLKVLVMKLTS